MKDFFGRGKPDIAALFTAGSTPRIKQDTATTTTASTDIIAVRSPASAPKTKETAPNPIAKAAPAKEAVLPVGEPEGTQKHTLIPVADLREKRHDLTDTPDSKRRKDLTALERETDEITKEAAYNKFALTKRIHGVLADSIPALEAFNLRLAQGKVTLEDGYVMTKRGRRYGIVGKKDDPVVSWSNERDNMLLITTFTGNPSRVTDFDVEVNIWGEDSVTFGMQQRGEDQTTVKLLWDNKPHALLKMQTAFANHPRLIGLLSLTENLGDNDKEPSYGMNLVITHEKAPSNDHPDGVPMSVALVLSQEDKITDEEAELKKRIETEKFVTIFGSSARHPSSLIVMGAVQNSIAQLEAEYTTMRNARFHTVTYTFDAQNNQFVGTTENTTIQPDLISAEDFIGDIFEGLFSLAPTRQEEPANPLDPQVTIVTLPQGLYPKESNE